MIKTARLDTDPSLGKIFLKYLFSGIGSAVMVSVYSIVDCIMVGQYEGPDGMAALAVITPVWTIIISLGLLFGIGGSVIFAKLRGEGDVRASNEIFTITLIGVGVVAAAAWAAARLGEEIGAEDDEILGSPADPANGDGCWEHRQQLWITAEGLRSENRDFLRTSQNRADFQCSPWKPRDDSPNRGTRGGFSRERTFPRGWRRFCGASSAVSSAGVSLC